MCPDLINLLVLIVLHFTQEIVARHISGETIGLGKQDAFFGKIIDLAGQQFFILEALHDLLGGQAFGNCHRMQDLFTRDKIVDHILDTGVGFKSIFAKADIGPFALPPESQFEQSRTVNHTFFFKLIDNLQNICARGDINNLFTWQRTGLRDLTLSSHKQAANANKSDQ